MKILFVLIMAVALWGCGQAAPSSSGDVGAPIVSGSGSGSGGTGSGTGTVMTPAIPSGMSACPADFIQSVFGLINGVRAQGGIAALTENAKLMAAAEQRSIDMATNQILSHNGWDTTINATGYAWSTLGENIADGYTTPASVVNGWVNSPGHYANIMTGAYLETGIGCVVDSKGFYWWTQDFGAP